MRLKKIISIGLALIIALINAIYTFAANPIVSVSCHGYDEGYSIQYSDKSKDCSAPVILLFVNGEVVSDADAIIKNGTTLVPLRIVSDKLGAVTNWDPVSRSVEITKGNIKIKLTIGKKI